jgi:putative ABC transport system permease protein
VIEEEHPSGHPSGHFSGHVMPPIVSKRTTRGLLSDLIEAFNNLRSQKTRTFLTALGIVFGVGSVIGMLAIGAGAREESLQSIERMGVHNVLIE